MMPPWMDVEVSAADPFEAGADLVAAAGQRALALGAPERAIEDADPVAIVYTAAGPLAVVKANDLRTAAAQAVRACRGGGTVAWALADDEDIGALAEGAVLGSYDGRRWRSGDPPRGVERFVICGTELASVA